MRTQRVRLARVALEPVAVAAGAYGTCEALGKAGEITDELWYGLIKPDIGSTEITES